MRITVDKNMTKLAELPKVKADIAEFKKMWLGEDGTPVAEMLKMHICGDLPIWEKMGNVELVSIDGKAFPAGYYYGDETHFKIHLVVRSFRKFADITAYMDMNGTISIWQMDLYGVVEHCEMM